MKQNNNKRIYGTAILKAKTIMDFIMESPAPPTLTEISRNTHINKATALKVLRTLELCDYVKCQGREKYYYLGTIFLRYAQTTLKNFNIETVAKPALSSLRDQTNETVNLGILNNKSAVLLSKLETPSEVKLISSIGKGLKLYSSSLGKALLSTFTDEALSDYITSTELKAITENTITNPDQLIKDIKLTQQRGYALEDQENQPDVICVGFPIVKDNHVYGAFSISAPKYRVSKEKMSDFIKYGQTAQKHILDAL